MEQRKFIHRNEDSRTVGEMLSEGYARLYVRESTGWELPDVGAAAWHSQIAEAPYDIVDIVYGI